MTLTAFVLAAISEVKLTGSSITSRVATAKSRAQKYLEGQASSLTDPYSLALVSYALYKSGSQNVDLTFGPLQKISKKDGMLAGVKYW